MQVTPAWARSSPEVAPFYFSSLLGHLVHGCHSIWLSQQDLDHPVLMPFLELAKPQHIRFEFAEATHTAAVDAVLAGCPFLRELTCIDGAVPTQFPQQL